MALGWLGMISSQSALAPSTAWRGNHSHTAGGSRARDPLHWELAMEWGGGGGRIPIQGWAGSLSSTPKNPARHGLWHPLQSPASQQPQLLMGMVTATSMLCSPWHRANVGFGAADSQGAALSFSFFFLIYGWNPHNCQREFHAPSDDRLNPCKNVSLEQKHTQKFGLLTFQIRLKRNLPRKSFWSIVLVTLLCLNLSRVRKEYLLQRRFCRQNNPWAVPERPAWMLYCLSLPTCRSPVWKSICSFRQHLWASRLLPHFWLVKRDVQTVLQSEILRGEKTTEVIQAQSSPRPMSCTAHSTVCKKIQPGFFLFAGINQEARAGCLGEPRWARQAQQNINAALYKSTIWSRFLLKSPAALCGEKQVLLQWFQCISGQIGCAGSGGVCLIINLFGMLDDYLNMNRAFQTAEMRPASHGSNVSCIPWEQVLVVGHPCWQYFLSNIHVKILFTGVCIISFVKKIRLSQVSEVTYCFKTPVNAKDPWFKPRLADLVASFGSSCLLYKHFHFAPLLSWHNIYNWYRRANSSSLPTAMSDKKQDLSRHSPDPQAEGIGSKSFYNNLNYT